MRFAHIINPVMIEGSDLVVAQPITFESMRVAAEYAAPSIEVALLSTQYPEDRPIVPPYFTIAPDLERSALDVAQFTVPRKLPLLGDILDRMRELEPDADYYIYTNVDIGLVPHFYASVAALLEDHDALVINRRTVPAEHNTVDQLPLIYVPAGEPHPGWDCFVFSSELFDSLELRQILIGVPWIGAALLGNLICHAQRLNVLEDAHLTFHLGADKVWARPEQDDYRGHNLAEMDALVAGWTARGLIEGRPRLEWLIQRLRRAQASRLPPPELSLASRARRRFTNGVRRRVMRLRRWIAPD